MNRISLTIHDESKIEFLRELISRLDFVEIKEANEKKKTKHSFFNSEGIWKGRDVSVETIRGTAWKRNH